VNLLSRPESWPLMGIMHKCILLYIISLPNSAHSFVQVYEWCTYESVVHYFTHALLGQNCPRVISFTAHIEN
jgi:hypothetical protein